MDRFILFPKKDTQLWKLYKNAEASFWTTEEIDLVHDMKDWNDRLNEKERHLITTILAFFASADGIVNENIILNLYATIPFIEAKYFYGFQIAMENIHAETYSLLIETYVKDKKTQEEVFRAVETSPSLKAKADWALRYMNEEKDVLRLLVAFACVEGIFFSGSFCAIFWLKKRGMMPGLCFSNELISRDEGMHCEFACLLYHKLCASQNRVLSDSEIEGILRDALTVEEEFIHDALPVELIGMNSKLMIQYLCFVGDRLYQNLATDTSKKLWNVSNPFDWMDMISLSGKTNFFEKRVGEYAKSGFHEESSSDVFVLDEEF